MHRVCNIEEPVSEEPLVFSTESRYSFSAVRRLLHSSRVAPMALRAEQSSLEQGLLSADMLEVDKPEMKIHVVGGGPSRAPLARLAVLSYGTGHMLNDLTAACWFTYLLIFITDIGLSPRQAGAVLMAGQIADALATLAVGRWIDAFGHFKLWHAGGTVLVAVSFSSVFGPAGAGAMAGGGAAAPLSDGARTLQYAMYAAIFNVGWAATQVSHMSLVNCITGNQRSRVALNSCRNSFTMIANLGLYGIALVVFETMPGGTQAEIENQFRWIALTAIAVGCVFIIAFYVGTGEPARHCPSSGPSHVPVSYWFKQLLYFQVALIYVLTRLATNVSQAILPLFLIGDLAMGASSKAVVPAVVYLSSLLASLGLQEMHWSGARLKSAFAVGASIWAGTGAALFFLPSSHAALIYGLSAAMGVANALVLVSATSMEGVLASRNWRGCAFVYGSLSFLDKLSCGLALFAIESLHSACTGGTCAQTQTHRPPPATSAVRWALACVPSGCCLLAAAATPWMDLRDAADNIHATHVPTPPSSAMAVTAIAGPEEYESR